MRALLLSIAFIDFIHAQSCPSQYQLIEGRCVRPLILEGSFVIDRDLQDAREECAKAEAHLPIIKSNEENELFNRIANSFPTIGGSDIWLVLDMTCNSTTRELEWIDGTSINYVPVGSNNKDFDCVTEQKTMLSQVSFDTWFKLPNSDGQVKTVLCVIDSGAATTIIPTTTKGVPTTTVMLPTQAQCPSQYQLIEGRCIRPLVLEQKFVIGQDLPSARTECAKAEAHLPIIKSNEENELFNRIANSFPTIGGSNIWLVLDMTCNSTTRELEWIDGTSINYVPKNSDSVDFDCAYEQKTMISEVMNDRWFTYSNSGTSAKTVLCVIDSTVATTIIPTTTKGLPTTTKPPVTDQCGDYTFMSNPTDDKKPCFTVYTDAVSWETAQRKCAAEFASLITINSAEENKYFWRTAVSHNIIEGMHIGAHQSTEDSQWAWSDGEEPIDGKTYDNFISYFPIPGAGNCSSMLTDNTAAYWINEDCQENNQPFMCRRSVFSSVPKSCPTDAPKAGEDIFPPGFPNADIACDYFLFVGAKKLVELEVYTLVADTNKDFLEILEGTSGPHLIANLTGSILTPDKFRTEKSNVMRVNWKPSGTGSGRGFRIRFNEVDA